jgi:hypothetical protein
MFKAADEDPTLYASAYDAVQDPDRIQDPSDNTDWVLATHPLASRACRFTSDNRYADRPARMADGRAFTDYRQPCKGANIGIDERRFLTRHGQELIGLARQITAERNPDVLYNKHAELPLTPDRVFKCDYQTCENRAYSSYGRDMPPFGGTGLYRAAGDGGAGDMIPDPLGARQSAPSYNVCATPKDRDAAPRAYVGRLAVPGGGAPSRF